MIDAFDYDMSYLNAHAVCLAKLACVEFSAAAAGVCRPQPRLPIYSLSAKPNVIPFTFSFETKTGNKHFCFKEGNCIAFCMHFKQHHIGGAQLSPTKHIDSIFSYCIVRKTIRPKI